jgi:dolichol kinase
MEREEYKRKAIHIGMGLWAFFPLIVTRYPALFICIIFLFLVLFIFRENRWNAAFLAMARAEDYFYGYLMGPLIYILAVMLCVGLYPPYIAAASFSIMAFGDGFATIIGKHVGRHIYPHSDKSVEGSLGFLFFGFTITILILWILTRLVTFPGLDTAVGSLARIALVGSIAGSIIETFPFDHSHHNTMLKRVFIDDNFFVPVLSGLIMTIYVMI